MKFKIALVGFLLAFPLGSLAITIDNPLGAESLEELIERIINAAFTIGIVVFPLMILWGAWTYMTSTGDPQKIETGKKILTWAIVGLGLILLSRAIIGIVKGVLTG